MLIQAWVYACDMSFTDWPTGAKVATAALTVVAVGSLVALQGSDTTTRAALTPTDTGVLDTLVQDTTTTTTIMVTDTVAAPAALAPSAQPVANAPAPANVPPPGIESTTTAVKVSHAYGEPCDVVGDWWINVNGVEVRCTAGEPGQPSTWQKAT